MTKTKLLIKEQGVVDLVVLAITLPILLTLFIVALDVIRLPMAKARLQQALENGYDYLVTDIANGVAKRRLNGRNWCTIVRDDKPNSVTNTCIFSCEKTAPANCTINTFKPDGSWASGLGSNPPNSTSLNLARNAIIKELQGGGLLDFGNFDPTNPPQDLNTTNIAVKIGVFYLVAKGLSVSNATSLQLVKSIKLGQTSWDGILPGLLPNQDTLITQKFIDANSPKSLGLEIAKNLGTHVPVVAISGAVRVTHFLKLTAGIKFGLPQSGEKETLLSATIIRPLPRSVWLSGTIPEDAGGGGPVE